MLLSAALIVRDEAASLDACLASLVGLVDEIVVVDTGSTDGSDEVARRHGATVARRQWRDDFAWARNEALDLARGQWILYVDADERVRRGDHGAARAALADAGDLVAGLVPFVPRVGWTPYREYRLWRHRTDIRFRGAMHETIVPAVTAAATREGLHVRPFDLLTIDHLGYEGDQRAKHVRDEPLLLAELQRQPDRAYLYDHLARIHEARGDSEGAVDAWRRGIDVARARGSVAADDVLLFVNLSVHLLSRGETGAEVGAVIADGLARFPGVPSLELAAARHEYATGDPASAAARAQWLVSLPPDAVIDTGRSYDPRVLGAWAWDLLGLCRLAMGDAAGAADAFAAAEAAAPGEAVYGVRRRLAAARSRATTAGP